MRVGVVHLGVGAFHRSHQQTYWDAIAAGGDLDWGVCGVGLLPTETALRDAAHARDGRYTLVTTAPDGTRRAQVIGSLIRYLHAPDDPAAVLDVLADPATRIVSLTITEGGYGIDDATGTFAPRDPLTLADLDQPDGLPISAFGYLAAALRRRRADGTPPFTVLSCDNIQHNGDVTRAALTAFTRRHDPALADWIAAEVAFPCTMVDRITPVTTDLTRAMVRDDYGIDDPWPVAAEQFRQWVIQDDFPTGRPDLATVGVELVPDVAPYEKLKLRILNASHQALAHLGMLAGHTWVHEAVADPVIAGLVRRYLTDEAVPTLDPLPGTDPLAYGDQVLDRFACAAVADRLDRIAVDASDRIPKFLLPVVRDQLAAGGSIDVAALVLAAWGVSMQRRGTTVVDRAAAELLAAVAREDERPGALLDVVPVFGELGADPRLRRAYCRAREALLQDGVAESADL
nr:mannitol dehydrogenase family protein [Cellulomonas denverensis]